MNCGCRSCTAGDRCDRDRRRHRGCPEQERVRLDQHRLPFRMRLRGDRCGREQALGERLGDGTRLRRPGCREVALVARDELDVGADLAELDEVRAAHHPAIDPVLAEAAGEVDGKEQRLAEQLGVDLEPGLLVLLPEPDESLGFLRVLDHVGEGSRLAGRDAGGSRRCCARPGGALAPALVVLEPAPDAAAFRQTCRPWWQRSWRQASRSRRAPSRTRRRSDGTSGRLRGMEGLGVGGASGELAPQRMRVGGGDEQVTYLSMSDAAAGKVHDAVVAGTGGEVGGFLADRPVTSTRCRDPTIASLCALYCASSNACKPLEPRLRDVARHRTGKLGRGGSRRRCRGS